MPIIRYFFILIVLTAGCGLLERQPVANIEETPPYFQPEGQLSAMRSYHDQNAAQMAEDIHIVRNREMERLETAGKEIQKEQERENGLKKTAEQSGKWTGWFKKKEGKETKESPLMSSRADDISRNLR